MHCLVCAVKHVVTKQVSCGHVYVQSCVMPSESYPTGGKGGSLAIVQGVPVCWCDKRSHVPCRM